MLRCCDNNEIVYIVAEDGKDKVKFSMENPGEVVFLMNMMVSEWDDLDNRRLSKFEITLMEIDAEQLSIPETSYAVSVAMPSSEFSRIVRDLSNIGDASCFSLWMSLFAVSCSFIVVTIAVTKSGVTFSTFGDIGNAEITLSPFSSGDMVG